MTVDAALIVAYVLVTIASAVLSTAETALTRISRAKALVLVEEHRRGAHTLLKLIDQDVGRWLNPLLLLALAAQMTSATLIGVIFESGSGLVLATATIINLLITFVLSEVVPKTFAIQHPERAGLVTAPIIKVAVELLPLRLLARALIGVSNVILPGKGLREGPFVSQDELRATVDETKQSGQIDEQERGLIHSVLELGVTLVREVMKPRTDVVSVQGSTSIAEALTVLMRDGYSRLPVTGQNIDDVVGVVLLKDLLRADKEQRAAHPVSTLLHEVRFVPETKRVLELLREMQHDKLHLAMVVDEYGGIAGLVTLEDLIEELVGEIVDEFDADDRLVEPLAGGGFRVSARMSVSDLNDLLGTDLPDDDWDTVGGLLIASLGRVPMAGQSVRVDGKVLVADRVQGRRVIRVRIEQATPAPAHGELRLDDGDEPTADPAASTSS